MATTNFFKNIGKHVLSGIIWFFNAVIAIIWPLLWAVICLALFLTSPVWMPLYIFCSPQKCALWLTNTQNIKGTWVERVFTLGSNILKLLLEVVYTPFISMLPMKCRAAFIQARIAEKPLNAYSAKMQVAYYYKACTTDNARQALLKSNALSTEAKEIIWEDQRQWENWLIAGVFLDKSKVKKLLDSGKYRLLWGYFKNRTPDKESIAMLVKGIACHQYTAEYVMLEFIKQQRPSAELVGQLVEFGRAEFIKSVDEIVDVWADLDAVNFTVSGGMPEDERKKVIAKNWLNFCWGKKHISSTAQNKMNYAQYQVYINTGHELDAKSLCHLCLTAFPKEYLEELIRRGFNRIDDDLLTALKTEYWRYSVYLAVKEERRQAKKKEAAGN